MNALTILLTALTSVFSLVGVAPEVLLERELRDQLEQAETLVVRVDVAPNYKLLQGQLDRLRLAGRGLYPLSDVRIDTLDIETDPVDLNIEALRQGKIVFDQPFQAAFNVVITQEDINQALRSPFIVDQLENISINLLGSSVGQLEQATLVEPEITLLGSDRIRFATTLLQSASQEQLVVELTTGVMIDQGTQLRLVEPELTANGVEFPLELVEPVIEGLSQQYSLDSVEPQGITARILRLQMTNEELILTSFIRIEAQSSIVE